MNASSRFLDIAAVHARNTEGSPFSIRHHGPVGIQEAFEQPPVDEEDVQQQRFLVLATESLVGRDRDGVLHVEAGELRRLEKGNSGILRVERDAEPVGGCGSQCEVDEASVRAIVVELNPTAASSPRYVRSNRSSVKVPDGRLRNRDFGSPMGGRVAEDDIAALRRARFRRACRPARVAASARNESGSASFVRDRHMSASDMVPHPKQHRLSRPSDPRKPHWS